MLSNGDMYEGHWENDVKHGPGTFFYMAKGCRCVALADCNWPLAARHSVIVTWQVLGNKLGV
jgi:hypothetical protein